MLDREPTAEELIREIGDPRRYREIVFCGYGEPLLRLDVVKSVAAWVKQRGVSVRLNTNGQGNLIHQRNILPELNGLIDTVSVSLNAQDAETYERVSRPSFRMHTPDNRLYPGGKKIYPQCAGYYCYCRGGGCCKMSADC